MNVILAVGWFFPENTGGTEVYVRNLALHLQAMGHSVVVIAPSIGSQVKESTHNTLRVFEYPIPQEPTRDEVQELIEPRYFSDYRLLLSELKPDIIHFHTISWAIGNHHIKAAKDIGCRVVVTMHTPAQGYLCPRGTNMRWGKTVCDGYVEPVRCGACVMQEKGIPPVIGFLLCAGADKFSFVPKNPLSRTRLGSMFAWPGYILRRIQQQNKLMDCADKVLCLSEVRRRILLMNGAPEEKVVLNRIGVSQEAWGVLNRPPDGVLVIGYVGRLDPIKGLEILIRAFIRTPPETRVCLKIFTVHSSETPYAVFIKKLAGSDRRIEFCPPVMPEKIASVFEQINVLAVPSLCMEGGPTVLLEAFACRVPVIGSNISAISEYIEHGRNGLLFEPGNVPALASTIQDLLADKNLLTKLITGIREVRTMKQVAQEMLELYQNLVPQR